MEGRVPFDKEAFGDEGYGTGRSCAIYQEKTFLVGRQVLKKQTMDQEEKEDGRIY